MKGALKMSGKDKASSSEKLFAWGKHADAKLEYLYFEMRLRTKLSLGKHSRTYILSPAEVTAKRGELVEALVEPTDEELDAMSAKTLRNWRYKKDLQEKKLLAYEMVQTHVDNDFSSGVGELECLFAVESNARAFIKNAANGVGTGVEGTMTNEEQFRAIILRLQMEFKPSVNLDLFQTKREFETLSDANGISFTDFHATHTRLYEECNSLGETPTDDTCETAIMEHFHNPYFEAEKKKMIMDRAHCKKASDRKYTWRTLLEECAIYCASYPKADTWGATQKEVSSSVQGQIARYTAVSKGSDSTKGGGGNSSGGGKQSYDSCWRCALSGHKVWKCSSTQCSKCKAHIGACPSGLRTDNLDHDSRKCKGSSSASSNSRMYFDPSSAKKKALESMVKVCSAKLVDKRKASGESESAPKKKKVKKLLRLNNGAALQPHPQVDQDDEEEEDAE